MSSSQQQQQQQRNGKLMPNLDQQSTKVLNLTVLQRIDPFIEEILITAAHVTFYKFNIDLNQWSRKDVEGSLFVVKRNTQPRFQFIVMNRRNTENLVEDLLGDFEYEVQKPYLLYRNAAQEVNGIWFYNPHECEAVANLFSRILNAFSKVPPKAKLVSVKSELDELEAVPSLAMMDGPLEPPSSSATAASDVPDESFVNLFNAALNVGNAPVSTVPEQQPQPSFYAPATLLNPVQIAISTPTPTLPSSVPSSMTSSHMPLHDATETNSSVGSNRAASLLKPSFFAPPAASSSLMTRPVTPYSAPSSLPLQPPITLQRPFGMPLLQPFPPPSPSPSLTPAPNYAPVITREKVRDALLMLAQNDQFVDMVYREILNAHYS